MIGAKKNLAEYDIETQAIKPMDVLEIEASFNQTLKVDSNNKKGIPLDMLCKKITISLGSK
jgi:hypothetical protein